MLPTDIVREGSGFRITWDNGRIDQYEWRLVDSKMTLCKGGCTPITSQEVRILRQHILNKHHPTCDFMLSMCGAALRAVFAYLTAPATTVCTAANTFYPIEGTFQNSPLRQFRTETNYIIYDDDESAYFEIDWHASLKIGAGATTISVGIKRNGIIHTPSVMSTLGITTNFSMSGTDVLELEKGDSVQLVVATSNPGVSVTFSSFTTTIRNFFG